MAATAEVLGTGMQHHQAGSLQAAAAIYRQILEGEPSHADAWHLLGVISHQTGDHESAVERIRRAIALQANEPLFHNNLGNVLLAQIRTGEGTDLDCHRCDGEPEGHEPHLGQEQAHKAHETLKEAITNFQIAVKLQPDFAEAHCNLGAAFHRLGELDHAVDSCRRALELQPNYAEADLHLGNALQAQGRLDEAIASYARALELMPNLGIAHNNLGTALQGQGKLDKAIASYRQALTVSPQYARAHYNLATACETQGNIGDAVSSYERAIELQPDDAMAHKNLALLLLLQGDFERGWPEYEWRSKCADYGISPLTKSPWDGTRVKTILLQADQGLGDTLQFIRYAPLVKQRVGEAWLRCPRELIPMVSRCKGIDRLIPLDTPWPACDAEILLTSLPRALGTTLANIPGEVPYLFPDPTLIEDWRVRLPVGEFRVGIAWQGNPRFKQDKSRSIPLESFAPIAEIPGVRLISLQKVHGREQLPRAQKLFPVLDLGPSLDETAGAFMDTAAVVMNLDLVVTSDTAVAHLAGGLGVPVWLALSQIPEWRWMLDRDDSPWYPSMRLFRQKSPGDWSGVMYQIRENLSRLVAGE